MRRIFRRLRDEFVYVCRYPAVLFLGAFLCALGGVMLWVSGGSSWYLIRTGGTGKLAFFFLLWLLTYAVSGFRLSVCWIGERRCASRRGLCFLSFFLTLIAYLFDLVWYVLYFCTPLMWFPLIILGAGAGINMVVIFLSAKNTILSLPADLAVIVVEIGFICNSISSLLLN